MDCWLLNCSNELGTILWKMEKKAKLFDKKIIIYGTKQTITKIYKANVRMDLFTLKQVTVAVGSYCFYVA